MHYNIAWEDISVPRDNRPYVLDNGYKPAGAFESVQQNINGNYLILEQHFETGDPDEWHISEDIVLALGLLREDDKWLSPDDDYSKVIRLGRDGLRRPCLAEMKAEYLKDYLNARNCGLLVSRYHERVEIRSSFEDVNWQNGRSAERTDNYRWEGHLNAIHEGGSPYGSKTAVFRVSRVDVDYDEDVPVLAESSDAAFKSAKWEVGAKGRKLWVASGELWKNDWIEPGEKSLRVRGDKIASTVAFIIDNSGNTASADELRIGQRWLWFRPAAANAILPSRASVLRWYTRDTGQIGLTRSRTVPFGVNENGLINVFAKDIADLPETHQRIWAAYNVPPEGGVSQELLMAQMETTSATTVAPEVAFYRAMEQVQDVSKHKLSRPILRAHCLESELCKSIHRFRSTDWVGMFSLCKDITRLIIERIDCDLLKGIRPEEDKEIGSIKRLARLLNETGVDGRKLTAPLVGIYDLRKEDAHLPPGHASESLSLLGIATSENFVDTGCQLIECVARSLTDIANTIEDLPECSFQG